MTKYQQVFEKIIDNIEGGLYNVENKLPSEKYLAEEFNVSINTLRKSLSLLIENGYIISRHGSGYYLSTHKNFNSLKLKSLGTTYGDRDIASKLLTFEIVQASDEQATKLNVDKGEAIFHITRLRLIDRKPLHLEDTIIPVRLFPTLNKEVFLDSFYNYIEDSSPHKISRAFKDISAVMPSQEVCDILEIETAYPLLVVENYVYLNSGEQFEYSYNYHLDKKLSVSTSNV